MTHTEPLVIVHEQLTDYGGVERVLENISRSFPHAPIFGIAFHQAVHERIRRLPNPVHDDPVAAPRDPFRFAEWCERTARWKLPPAHVVLALVQSGWSLALTAPPDAMVVAYASGLSRPYVWDCNAYLAALPLENQAVSRDRLPMIRSQYRSLLANPDELWAPSLWSARRIERWAKVPVAVVSPDRPHLTGTRNPGSEGFAVVSRLVRHKAVETAVQAFAHSTKTLRIVGTGPDRERLASMAGPTTRFEGFLPDRERVDLITQSEAVICPPTEEFGLSMVEALALGIPVIAPCAGAAAQIVGPGAGVLIDPPMTPQRLADIIDRFDPTAFDPQACMAAAQRAHGDRTVVDSLRTIVARKMRGDRDGGN